MGIPDEFNMNERLDLAPLATFIPNKNTPVYNWFYYKEGFSRQLVMDILDRFTPENVLDPFCGSGTTLLACKERGIDSMGYDVVPIALLAANVKTRNYDIEQLKAEAKRFLKERFQLYNYDVPKLMTKAFSIHALRDIIFFKKVIRNYSDPARSLFLLALINASMKVSYAWKDGSVIKFQKRGVPPLRIMLRRTIYNMIRDLEHTETKDCSVKAHLGDARRLDIDDNSISSVITSPPYLNRIDYSAMYTIENFILGDDADPQIRSYVHHYEKDAQLPEYLQELPGDARPYFSDMQKAIQEMHRVCRPGASVAMVVGNGFIDQVIESDLILAQIAKNIGFNIEEITVINKRFALKNRTQKAGVLRESIIFMEK